MTTPDQLTTSKSAHVPPNVHQYLVAHSTPLDEVQVDLIAETAELGGVSQMQVAPEQGLFLTLLARMLGATSAVEVGTFTGFSSLCIARGLAPGGRLLCCDVSEEWTAVARRYWARAGVDDRIELRIGLALDTLRAMPVEPAVDLAFIDADKVSYVAYWDELIPRLRSGGVVTVDNVLWSGRVADPSAEDADTVAIRAFNRHAVADDRVELVMLPIADGLTIARKR
ncbi:MAG: O-methyltransferase [Acidimicrobiales bacterium]